MKKILVGLFFALGIFTMAGCSSSSSDDIADKGNIKISVNSGKYIIVKPDDDKSPEQFLALKVKVENKTNGSFDVGVKKDFSLKDESGKEIKATDLYKTNLSQFDYDDINKNKSKTNYVYFKVSPNDQKQYTLKYHYSVIDDVKTNAVKIDPKNYPDTSQDSVIAMQAIIDKALLNKDNSNFDKYNADSKKKLAKQLHKIVKQHSIFGATLSDFNPTDEVVKMIQDHNRDVGSTDIKVIEFDGKKATLSVTANEAKINMDEVVETSRVNEELNKKVFAAMREKGENDTVWRSGESKVTVEDVHKMAKNITVEKLPAAINEEQPRSSDPIEIKLVKTNGKWKLDKYEYDDSYMDLARVFGGQPYSNE